MSLHRFDIHFRGERLLVYILCGLGPEWNGSEWVQELEMYVNPVDLRPMCLNILEILFEFFSLIFFLQIPYINLFMALKYRFLLVFVWYVIKQRF